MLRFRRGRMALITQGDASVSPQPWTPDAGKPFTRRDVLRHGAAGLLALGSIAERGQALAEEPGIDPALIVRSRRPIDLETPVSKLDTFLTPNNAFFVRSHFGAPMPGFTLWPIEVGGTVSRALDLDEAALGALPKVKVTAVLQCSGNGRSYFRPNIPGVPWERGAVGNAEWGGVRLADVLGLAGTGKGAAHVHLLGADGPPSPKTPLFLRSIPLEKAIHPDTILATTMNGDPLPELHGGPVRLVVPGWAANHWLKWVRSIHVSKVEAPGFYMQTGYRMPKSPSPPEVVLKPSDLKPVTALNVKSLITWPLEGSILRAGANQVRGVAWTGEGRVTHVEVATQTGDQRAIIWVPATLEGEPKPWSWRRWRMEWNATIKGRTVLRSRATDTDGETQPETTPWNKSGYLWNGIDRVTCEVG